MFKKNIVISFFVCFLLLKCNTFSNFLDEKLSDKNLIPNFKSENPLKKIDLPFSFEGKEEKLPKISDLKIVPELLKENFKNVSPSLGSTGEIEFINYNKLKLPTLFNPKGLPDKSFQDLFLK